MLKTEPPQSAKYQVPLNGLKLKENRFFLSRSRNMASGLNDFQWYTSWWFHPFEDICQIGSSPQVGVNIKHI